MVDQEMKKAALLELLHSHAFSGDAGKRDCLDEIRCSRFIDGKLTESERRAVISHLADCRNCTDLVAGVVHLRRDDVATIPPDLLAAALELKPRQQPTRVSSEFRWQKQFAVAASIILIVGAFVWQFEELPDPGLANDTIQPINNDQSDVRIGAHDQERVNIISPVGDTTVDPNNLNLQWSRIDRSVFQLREVVFDCRKLFWESRNYCEIDGFAIDMACEISRLAVADGLCRAIGG